MSAKKKANVPPLAHPETDNAQNLITHNEKVSFTLFVVFAYISIYLLTGDNIEVQIAPPSTIKT